MLGPLVALAILFLIIDIIHYHSTKPTKKP